MDFEKFDFEKDGCIYFGVTFYNEDGEEMSNELFDSEEEREEAIDRWYSEQDEHTLDQ